MYVNALDIIREMHNEMLLHKNKKLCKNPDGLLFTKMTKQVHTPRILITFTICKYYFNYSIY